MIHSATSRMTSVVISLMFVPYCLAAIAADDPDNMTIVNAWVEAVAEGEGGAVQGWRVLDSDHIARDYYVDSNGEQVSDIELRAWGIPPKNWDTPAYEMPAFYPDWRAPDGGVSQVPWTLSKGICVPDWAVPPLDESVLREEDAWEAENAEKSPLRVGVVRELEVPVQVTASLYNAGELFQWQDGSWLWAFSLRAPGAVGLRLHLEEITLPENSELLVYSRENPADVYSPCRTESGQWLPTCLGETVVIECRGNEAASLESVRVRIDAFVHLYRSPIELEKAIGACHIDLPCRPEWGATGAAVGRMTYIRNNGSYLCTGALIASSGYVNTPPLFLTAFHCIGSQTAASTLEVWWQYALNACGGMPPDLASVPRTTGGARFLAGSRNDVGMDVSLLVLNSDPPAGLPVAGFSTLPAPVGEAAVCIHHPQGSVKKISFGDITDQGSPSEGGVRLKPIERYHEVVWGEGTTEGGSSGSPLLSGVSGLIIGQLFGGYAACSAIYEPDYYGRFDVSYPILERFLVSETGYLEGEPPAEGEGEPCENRGCRRRSNPPCPSKDTGQDSAERLASILPHRIDGLILLAVSGAVLHLFSGGCAGTPRPSRERTDNHPRRRH